MKNNFFPIAAMIAATTLLFSCISDNQIPAEEGKPASVKLSINFPNNPDTRANSEAFCTAVESKANVVDVFIYTTTGYLATHVSLKDDDFTPDGTAKISTTTGVKNVYAGVNLPEKVVNDLKNKPASALSTVAQTLSRAEMAGESFIMFSKQPVGRTFVENENDPANRISIQVQRLVAKITVETAHDMRQAGIQGKLGNLMFAVNNFNTSIFLFQNETPHKDPNWAASSYDPCYFEAASANEYVDILRRTLGVTPTTCDYKARYAAENTSEAKRKKEITRVTVRATFIPEKIYGGTATDLIANNAHGITVPRNFYSVNIPGVENYLFFDETLAYEFGAYKNTPVIAYENGFCYWDIFLNSKPLEIVNKCDVLRNDFYRCNITRIYAPGRHTPDIPDDELNNTPDDYTGITVDIDILDWNEYHLSDYELD